MRLSIAFTSLATLALEARFVAASSPVLQARQAPLAYFELIGDDPRGSLYYPSYNLSIPQDGTTYEITNPTVIVEIEPFYSSSDGTPTSNCTFVGAEGYVAIIDEGAQDLDGPQAVVSVRCNPVGGSGSSSTVTISPTLNPIGGATSTPAPTTTSIGSTYLPPYPTGTGYYPYSSVGTSKPTASGGAGPTGTGGGFGSGTTVPFTGDAARFVESLGGSLLAFAGLAVAL